jgi:hypothetical protein
MMMGLIGGVSGRDFPLVRVRRIRSYSAVVSVGVGFAALIYRGDLGPLEFPVNIRIGGFGA